MLELPYRNPHPLVATSPYFPMSIGDATPVGCPERPWWWLVAAAAAGAAAGYAWKKKAKKARGAR